jgi:hypothetical protein
MTVASVRLTESLQTLIDARLDTIDRMLLGRVPRSDRLAIVRDLETQIFELLQEHEGDELGRDDVLAVLARLDPPEAYLLEETDAGQLTDREPAPSRTRPLVRRGPGADVANVSGVLGLSALILILLTPLVYVAAKLLESEAVLFVGGFGVGGLIFVGGLVGLVLGNSSRRNGVWAILGMVTSFIALLFSSVAILYMLFLLAASL